jgi:NTE family protein
MKRKTVGLALGSGGIRGLAHVGVIKTLLKHNIPIDYIAGSSIGAWVGAHYALFEDLERLEEFTVNRKEEKLRSFFEPSLNGGLIAGGRTRTLLSEWLDQAEFKDTKIPLSVVATDLRTREASIFSEGDLAPAVQASMAIPGMFRPISYEGKILVDGGVTKPVPTDVVKHMGADIVISVNLYRLPPDPEDHAPGMNFIAVASRTMEILRYQLSNTNLHLADIVMEPLLGSYSSWTQYFRTDIGPEIVAIGEAEAEKHIEFIKALLDQKGIPLTKNHFTSRI